MTHRSMRRRAALATATSGAVAAALISMTGVGATAAGNAEPASTPVDIVTPDGAVSSYLLNARIANPGQTRLIERAVEKAGGVVVQSWPQIGVVVAHADVSTFRTEVKAAAGRALDSVGATRTVPVSEGTPAELGANWGPGASG